MTDDLVAEKRVKMSFSPQKKFVDFFLVEEADYWKEEGCQAVRRRSPLSGTPGVLQYLAFLSKHIPIPKPPFIPNN